MAYKKSYALQFLSHIDRPDPEKVISLAKRSYLIPKLVWTLAAPLVIYLLMTYFDRPKTEALMYAGVFGGANALAIWTLDLAYSIANRFLVKATIAFGVIGMFAGLVYSLAEKAEIYDLVKAGLVAGLGASIVVGLILFLFPLVCTVTTFVGKALGAPIGYPILATVAFLNRHILRTKHKAWYLSSGFPIITFGIEGVSGVFHGNERLCVASPDMRTEGNALANGIPLFTWHELSNSAFVQQRLHASTHALQSGSDVMQVFTFADDLHGDSANSMHIDHNPANGLPMMGGIGGVDVSGNVYGTDHNHV